MKYKLWLIFVAFLLLCFSGYSQVKPLKFTKVDIMSETDTTLQGANNDEIKVQRQLCVVVENYIDNKKSKKEIDEWLKQNMEPNFERYDEYNVSIIKAPKNGNYYLYNRDGQRTSITIKNNNFNELIENYLGFGKYASTNFLYTYDWRKGKLTFITKYSGTKSEFIYTNLRFSTTNKER
ncbi:hypothetical protein [Pedobacter paludis]|uniref:Uncharacterized protein n=1 Tax=Pedobacter paludis TaxID=2203212 RepID=A0A317EY33_9SPHI|nr:hypothetical protein [Pedobacter paludis]PWS30903.1 hypothetical protein DF947_14965 [Pedobacter paludis]